MTPSNALPRLTHLLAIVFAMLSLSVCAQPQPQPQQPGPDADPPARVARMSYASGRVSFSPAGNDTWVEAHVNRPIVTGDRLWSDSDSRAELAIDDSTWWLGDTTSVAVSNLDDRIVQMQVQEGTLEVNVRRVPADNIVEIDTPNLAFSITRPGRYRVEVDAQDGSTMVAVRQGGGEVYGEGSSYVINAGQAYRFYGTDVSDSEFVSLPPMDEFGRFVQDRDRIYASSTSLRYVSPTVVGYQDLDRYGAWNVEATYGNVWFPREVRNDWAPYREGHWTWIDPWGWTWVDDEPWGFAPFHYGRWAHFSRGWGWVPGPRSVRAVYAPALVAFVGGAGFSLSVSSGPAIGWFPLAPREVYVPPYRASRNYFQRVNVTNTVVNVTNITNIYNNPTRISQLTYANRRAPDAVTAVPPAAFAQSQNVRRAAIALPAAAMQRGQVNAIAPVAPARPAFLGAAPAAQVRPPAATMQRQVVAKAPPPPPPVPDAQKVQALEKNPGRPLTRADVQTLRRATPPAAASAAAPAPAKVVSPPKPAANAAPPAREAGTRRPNAAAKGPPGAAPEAAPKGPPGARPEVAPKGPPGTAPEAAPKGPPGAAVPQARGPNAPPSSTLPRNAPQGTPSERAAPSTQGPPPSGAGTLPGAAERRARPEAPDAAPQPGVARPPQARRPETGAAPGTPERAVPSAPPATPGRPEAGPRGLAPRPGESAPATPRSLPQPAPQPRAAPEPQRPPEARPQPQRPPEARPQPQRPPEARPQPQPAPEARPQPQRPPEARPQPQRPPEARPQPQRPPEARPQPQPPSEARPQPQRPPEARPQPQPEAARRPEPPRGPPPQAARPAPEQRPAAQRPPPKDEKGKDKDKDKEGNG
jgi:hypothetical protein